MPDSVDVPLNARRIRAICLPRGECSVVLRHVFGDHRFIAEYTVELALRKICPGYVPGRLQAYALENGSLFLAPTGQQVYRIDMGRGRFHGDVRADIAGMVASSVAFGHLAHEHGAPVFDAVRYHLRQFMLTHPDWKEIERVLA